MYCGISNLYTIINTAVLLLCNIIKNSINALILKTAYFIFIIIQTIVLYSQWNSSFGQYYGDGGYYVDFYYQNICRSWFAEILTCIVVGVIGWMGYQKNKDNRLFIGLAIVPYLGMGYISEWHVKTGIIGGIIFYIYSLLINIDKYLDQIHKLLLLIIWVFASQYIDSLNWIIILWNIGCVGLLFMQDSYNHLAFGLLGFFAMIENKSSLYCIELIIMYGTYYLLVLYNNNMNGISTAALYASSLNTIKDLQGQIAKLQAQNNMYYAQLKDKDKSLDQNKAVIKSHEDTIIKQSDKISGLNNDIFERDKTIDKQSLRIKYLEELIDANKITIASQEAKNKELTDTVSNQKTIIENQTLILNTQGIRIKYLEGRLTECEKNRIKLSNENKDLTQKYNSLKKLYDDLNIDINVLLKLKDSYDALKKDNDEQKTKYNGLKAEFDALKASYDALKTDRDTIKAELDVLKASCEENQKIIDLIKIKYPDIIRIVMGELVQIAGFSIATNVYFDYEGYLAIKNSLESNGSI